MYDTFISFAISKEGIYDKITIAHLSNINQMSSMALLTSYLFIGMINYMEKQEIAETEQAACLKWVTDHPFHKTDELFCSILY